MKIIELADYYNNKTGNPLSIISEMLAKKGFEVEVVASNLEIKPQKMTEQDYEKSPVHVIRFNGIRIGSRAIFPGLIPFLLTQSKDTLIHAHVAGFYSTFMAALIKPLAGYRLIINSDYDSKTASPNPGIYHRMIQGWPLKRAERIICWTNAEKKAIVERFGIPEEKIRVIPIGIHANQTQKQAQNPFPGKFVLLSACMLSRKKNIEMILEALQELEPDTVFVHVGGIEDPEYFNGLEQLVREKKLQSRVKFLGAKSLEEIYAQYSYADAAVNAGFNESYCIPVLEGMACGRVMLSAPVGIANEVIEEGKTGFLVHNAQELAQKIRKIRADPALRKKIESNAKERARKFDWNTIIEQYISVFSEGTS
ncbi:MAG: glycosyltransferase family 4 protein [Candidatus Diapherotrites archaeon]|nr:glycosyltransferase family 4 protein [Candidatus Diapherotrites archaeon]